MRPELRQPGWLPPGCVLDLRFDAASDQATVIHDRSGRGHHCTLSASPAGHFGGGVWLSNKATQTQTSAYPNPKATPTRTTIFGTVPNHADLQFGQGGFAVELMMQFPFLPAAGAVTTEIFELQGATAFFQATYEGAGTGAINALRFSGGLISPLTTRFDFRTPAVLLSTAAKYHIVFVRNTAAEPDIYVNGGPRQLLTVVSDRRVYNANVSDTADFLVGKGSSGVLTTGGPWHCLRLYNRSLSALEAGELYARYGRAAPACLATIGFLNDSHVGSGASAASLTAQLVKLAAFSPDAYVVTGDLTDGGTIAQCNDFAAAVAGYTPLYWCPGNHDHDVDGDAFKARMGVNGFTPTSFPAKISVKGIDLLLLDNVKGDGGLAITATIPVGDLAWLTANIDATRPSLLVMHWPLSSTYYTVTNKAALLAALAGTRVCGVLTGHDHAIRDAVMQPPWSIAGHAARAATSWGLSAGCRIVKVFEGGHIESWPL